MRTEYPTQKRLKELFDYRNDGKLIWKVKKAGINDNCVAGCICSSTHYCVIGIDNKSYKAHRLIWIWHKGYDPENDIDHHPDRIRSNNRIENLRDTTRSCNLRNTGNRKNNTSGVKGTCWGKSRNRWISYITLNKCKKFLGHYDDFNEAVLVRLAAEQCLDWSSCDSSSPAYQYAVKNKLIRRNK